MSEYKLKSVPATLRVVDLSHSLWEFIVSPHGRAYDSINIPSPTTPTRKALISNLSTLSSLITICSDPVPKKFTYIANTNDADMQNLAVNYQPFLE